MTELILNQPYCFLNYSDIESMNQSYKETEQYKVAEVGLELSEIDLKNIDFEPKIISYSLMCRDCTY